MFKRYLKPTLIITILIATIGAFIYYFITNPAIRQQLSNTSIGLLVVLVALYLCVVGAVGLILVATLVLCNVKIGGRESLLVTMYSSIINFFGPLQSGPAFRAVYLKKKHGLKLKDYTLATLVYYAFFATFSGIFLLSGYIKWWLLPGALFAILGGLWLWKSQMNIAQRLRKLNLRGLTYLGLATLLQVSIICVIYYIELRSVDPGVHLSQAVVYTGAANFALFVSLTPGAIGFREAFLLFSQNLHHISNSTIVAASILDRTVYIVMLLILVVFIFGTHAQAKLQVKNS